ncbi:hypothetical protein [Microbacterium sp. P5_E9]
MDHAVTPPFVFGLSFDIAAANPNRTEINIGGVWSNALNCNSANINNLGTFVGVGSSPNRDVRVVDNLVIDNNRYLKFNESGGANKKVLSVAPSDNTRFIAPAATKQWGF